MKFLKCETAEDSFGSNQTPCNNDVDMNWVMNADINYQNRAYQREKVSLVFWNKVY